MKKIKIGILGCASIADRSVIPSILELEEFELIAIASRSSDKSNFFCEKFGGKPLTGYSALLDIEDIDAVYIPLPTGLHAEWVSKCLEAGMHVLSEKSLGMDFTETGSLVKIAQTQYKLLFENYMFVYHGQHKVVRNIIDSGEIGEVRMVRSMFGFSDLPKDNFRFNRQLGGGALLDVGGYTLKACTMYMGDTIRCVGANLYKDNGGVDIYGGAMFVNDDGITGQVGFGFDNFYQCNYEIWGTTGKLIVEKAFTPKPNFEPTIKIISDNGVKIMKVPAENHFKNALKEFARIIFTNNYVENYNSMLLQSKLQTQVMQIAKEIIS